LKSEIWSWVVVVDEDINPMDIEEVIWAIRTRRNPEKGIDTLRSKAIIDACRLFPWRSEFSDLCD